MSSSKANSLWAWPGPFRLYEWLIAAILCLGAYFSRSGFAVAIAAALMVCGVYLTAVFDKDLTVKDWSRFNYVFWIIRLVALGTAYLLYIRAPTTNVRFATLLVYAALYIFSEGAAWHRKKTIEAAILQ